MGPAANLRPRPPRYSSSTFNELFRWSLILYVLSGLAAVAAFLTWGVLDARPGFVYISAAIVASLIPFSIAIAKRRFDFFEPINVVGLTIFFGTTLRAFYVVFLPERPRARFLMMEQDFVEVNDGMIWILLAIASLCLGYVLSERRISIGNVKYLRDRALILSRFNTVLMGCLAVSIIGCALYVANFGIDLSGDLLSQSQKRSIVYDDDVQGAIYGSAWQGQLASVGLYAGFVLACAMIAGRVRATPRWLALLAALLFFGSVGPLLGQSRSPLIITAFSILVFAHYYGRVKPWHAGAVLGVAVPFLTVMGALRESNSMGIRSTSGFLDSILGSGNGFDAIRTASIMGKMPGQADYLHGESLVSLFFVLVPRTFWPDKPRISMGGWVREELFGVRTQLNGWPPGLVAEGYMNFGYLGMIILPFLIGIALRMLYETVRPKLGQSFLITIIYAAVLYGIGFKLIALNLSLALAATFMALLPAMLIIVFSSGKSRAPAMAGHHVDRRHTEMR